MYRGGILFRRLVGFVLRRLRFGPPCPSCSGANRLAMDSDARAVTLLTALFAASLKWGCVASNALRACGAAAERTGLINLANNDFKICGKPEPF